MKAILSAAKPAAVAAILLPAFPSASFAGEASGYETDRTAILRMAGDFRITFQFFETATVKPDYELRPPFRQEAMESVRVVVDQPGRIVLQHLLITGEDEVIKHWRQDWRYEDRTLFEFDGDHRWMPRTLTETEAKGAWSQRVTSVDDSPRYEGFGKWTHHGNLSSWTSNPTRRPLPRREIKTRDDYDVLIGVNRHTITADGWVHEQDNYKQVDAAGEPVVLCREAGFNRYQSASSEDFQKAEAYWSQVAPWWDLVNAAWDELDAQGRGFQIVKPPTAAVSLSRWLFSQETNPHEVAAPAALRERLIESGYVVPSTP